jgi:hypothetical protein
LQLRERFKAPKVQMMVGLVFLLLANVSQFLLRRAAMLSENLGDGMIGVFFGAGIALLLLSVVNRNKQRRAA